VGLATEWVLKSAGLRDVFKQVDEAIGEPVCSKLLVEGPQEELTRTENAQPAILGFSIGLLRALSEEEARIDLDDCCAVIGHSLGEFSAMVAAGALSLSDAAKLVRARGKAMQLASDRFFSERKDSFAMTALMPASFSDVEQACASACEEIGPDAVCQIANFNSSKQVVISGTAPAVERASEISKKEFKVRRATPLQVSAPFHCPIMFGARDSLKAELEEVHWAKGKLKFPIISNVTGKPVFESSALKALALEQLTAPVLWSPSVLCANEELGAEEFIEVGGKVVSSFTPTILGDRKYTTHSFI